MGINYYNEPIIHRRRKGSPDDPFIEIDETLTLDSNAKAILTEIPNEYHRVKVTGDNKEWHEIVEGELGENQFKVDYKNKIVTFHISQAGKQLTFSYLGEGTTLIPVSMIYTERDGDIIKTLDQYTNSLNEAVNMAEQMVDNENQRISNENERKSNEETRISNESTREANESTRQTNESARETNENTRISNENTRQTKEEERQANESTRISNENTRQANEQIRQQQEQQRQTDTANAIANAQQATENANNAATNANDKANLADQKATLAQEKINSLNALEAQINQTITESQTATENANTSATNANDKANYAQQQGDYAKAQGDYAKQQGDTASSTIANVNNAIANAEQAIANANNATENANTAVTQVQNIVDNTRYVEPYNPNTTYQKNNIVTYNGSSFIAKQTTTGNTPIGDANDVYWGLLAQKGIDGMGSVSSVNNLSPDTNGNVTITPNDIGAIPASQKGVPNGVALLNEEGKVVDSNGNLVEGKVTSVNGKIGDVILSADDVGAETPEKAQQKADQAEQNAKAYTDTQITLVTETGVPKLVSYQYVLTASTDNQTDFNIPLSTFDKDTDTVIVIQNRTSLEPTAYTIDDFDNDGTYTIRLNESVVSGTDIHIIILKNVPIGSEGSINGRVLAERSIPIDRIIEDVILSSEKGQPNGVATLDENGKISSSQLNVSGEASSISVTDSGDYYASTDVEGVLQEIGQTLNSMRSSLITSINSILDM